MRPTASLILVALAGAGSAAAYPEGAPWGAANPEAAESCSDCHYDYEPVHDSSALSIAGLPRIAVAGTSYEFRLRFAPDSAAIAGFQLLAAAERDAGSIRSDDPAVESIGAASRSTMPAAAAGGACWTVRWRAPQDGGAVVTLHLAAAEANDDQSPLGDRIHYWSYRLDVVHAPDARIGVSPPVTTEGDPP